MAHKYYFGEVKYKKGFEQTNYYKSKKAAKEKMIELIKKYKKYYPKSRVLGKLHQKTSKHEIRNYDFR